MHNKSAKRLLKLLGNCKLIFLADGLRVSVRQRAHATAEGSVRMQRLVGAGDDVQNRDPNRASPRLL
jgi:hypothetical protein